MRKGLTASAAAPPGNPLIGIVTALIENRDFGGT